MHILSIVESPAHPRLDTVLAPLGHELETVASQRKAIAAIKKKPPDVVFAEFFYGWGNNYAGVNISNLDVFLYSLQRYAPQARVVVMVDKAEREYVDKLEEILPLAAVLINPVSPEQAVRTLGEITGQG
ncbi:MAG: hypothetical protein ACPGU7_13140 [Gammaproteobacteria bacterium]